MRLHFLYFLWLFVCLYEVDGLRILVQVMTGGNSHVKHVGAMVDALVDRGHIVVRFEFYSYLKLYFLGHTCANSQSTMSNQWINALQKVVFSSTRRFVAIPQGAIFEQALRRDFSY